jgi:hypothetical protein
LIALAPPNDRFVKRCPSKATTMDICCFCAFEVFDGGLVTDQGRRRKGEKPVNL